MIDPSGPLPPTVYRRRRALAAGGAVAALVLVVWVVGALTGRGDPALDATPVPAGSSSPPPQAETPTAPSSSSTTPPPPPPPAAEPPKPTPPPGPPQPCDAAQVSVKAEVEKASYPVGEQVGFKILVSNTGPLPCAKEIGRAVRELVVSSVDGATRLWSSNDCFNTGGSEVRVLRPGEVFDFGIKWRGTTSEPGCAKHTRLGPGDYLLTAWVAGKASDPVVFRMT
ncbi:hypothetical protein SUDANB95_06634 [Actinosynnema sp. ALI-1.44]